MSATHATPSMRQLELAPLTAEAFTAFGDVVDVHAPCERLSINEGRTWRHHALASVDCSDHGGNAILSVFRAHAIEDNFVLRSMERHPLGSQAFINTSGNPYAVVVAPPGELDEARIRGFLAGADQSVSYHRGTWHHYLLALHNDSDFVVVDRAGPGHNCDEQQLQTPITLAIADGALT